MVEQEKQSRRRRHVDPNRVKKDEFLHRIFSDHKDRQGTIPLSAAEMVAAANLAIGALKREGVVMGVPEVMDVVNEMTHAIRGDTTQALHQLAERKRNRELAATYQRRKNIGIREMLERGPK